MDSDRNDSGEVGDHTLEIGHQIEAIIHKEIQEVPFFFGVPFEYWVKYAQTAILTIVVTLAFFNFSVLFLDYVSTTKVIDLKSADLGLKSLLSEDEQLMVLPFVDLVKNSSRYTSSTKKNFINAMDEFTSKLDRCGIKMPNVLDPRLFTNRNTGTFLIRTVDEVPAQVTRHWP